MACGAARAAEAPAPAALAEPSFEGDEGATPSDWRVTLEAGAEGRVSWTAEARTGKRALLVEKTNGLGFLMLTSVRPVAVKPVSTYESAVSYRLKRREYGTRLYFCSVDVDAAGTDIMPPHYSPRFLWVPRFARDGEWERHACLWKPAARAVGTRLRFLVVGGPATVLLDDFEVVADPAPVVHLGQGGTSEKPFDVAAARAILAKRQPLPARVQSEGNRPLFMVGDKVRTALVHQAAYGSAAASRYGGFGRCGVHLHTVTVQMGPMTEKKNVAWKYPGGFDFSDLEEGILRVVHGDPEGWVILQVRCDLPRQWGIDHPDDVWTEAGGKAIVPKGDCHPGKLGTSLAEGEYFVGSYGSPRYRDDMARAVAELGRFVRTSEAGKVVVGFIIGGGNDGQFFDWSPGWQGHLDQSPGHQQGFREWLREAYGGSAAALRAAWGDPAADFDTATVCAETDRVLETPFLKLAGPQRRVADSNRYASLAPVRLMKHLARTLKQAIGRPVFSMCYYPDAVHDGGSNHYALTELLSGPDRFDSATAVQDYGEYRQVGGTGGTNASWGAHRLRGSAQLCEIDYRTFRSYAAGAWGMGDLGAPDTAEGFRAQIRRDIGATAARGMGAWYYDMSGGWYDDPKLWSVVEESNRILAWAHRPDVPGPAAEMAVFVDEDAGWRLSRDAFDLTFAYSNAQRIPLNLSGVPYDVYLLDDIRSPKLPEYRAYLFLTSYTLTREQAAAIQRRCRKPGKVVAFLGTPGQGSSDFGDPAALVAELTGIRCDWRPVGSKLACVPAPGCADPIAKGLAGAFTHEAAARHPVLVPADPEAVVFGTFAADGKPSHALKRGPKGTALFFAGGLTPQLAHNIAVEAGIHTLGTPGQVVSVGCGVATIHRVQPGDAAVTFATPVDLIDPDTEKVTARRVTEWRPDVAMLDTALTFYKPAK